MTRILLALLGLPGLIAAQPKITFEVQRLYPSKELRAVLHISQVNPNVPDSPSSYTVTKKGSSGTVAVQQVQRTSKPVRYAITADLNPLLAGKYQLNFTQSGALTTAFVTIDSSACATNPLLECLAHNVSVATLKTTNRQVTVYAESEGRHLTITYPASPPPLSEMKLDLLDPVGKNVVTGTRDMIEPGPDVYLVLLMRSIHDGDTLQVSVGGEPPQDVKVSGTSPWLWSLTPAYVQSQELTNGKKRPVGQLTSVIHCPVFSVPTFRSYLTNTNVVSSDGKDKDTKLDLTYGFERTFTGKFGTSDDSFATYHPFQVTLLSNQVGSNVSLEAGPGITLLFPPVPIDNAVLHTPIGPEFGFDLQYQRRFLQDDESRKQEPRRDGIRVASKGTWTPLRILSRADSTVLYGEIVGYGWFLPIERNELGKSMKRLEGRIEASLLVPITALSFNGQFSAPGDKPKTQIRFKFTDGADDANGYKHSRSLSLGVEAVK